ncbi:tatD [Mytilus coruscus]|uniref:TatD n=1 Tax=Mytilus coruscus TaxID=42192 RepID=A0A6J8EEB7_MYTCO|nr:tatD [Mytilus coruscus]
MEEEELDYEPEEKELGPVKEQRIRGSSNNRKRSRPCCICTGRFVNVRRHVLRAHVPWYTAPLLACWTCQLQFGQQGALTIHCNDYHNSEQTHGYKDEFLVDWVEMMIGLLIELCRQFKILALLIKSSEDSENLLSYSCKMSLCKISSYPIHTVIDTHFHWDKFFLQARFSGLPSYIWEEQGNEKFQIRKLISNFVFPSRWRACLDGDLLSKDKRILHTIGVHPKIAGNQVGHHLKELKKRIPGNFIAIGECGLDISQEEKDLREQIKVLRVQLELARDSNLPVVIHCRGENITARCLDIMTELLDRKHGVHWHCFSQDEREYENIKRCFPNTKFGISSLMLMEDKYPQLRSQVCEMSLADIIVESDSPYIQPKNYEDNSPVLIKAIIQKLSIMFNTSGREIAEITTRNAQQLYKLE